MADYKHYTAEDLLADESFVNYLLKSNKADESTWRARRKAGLLDEQQVQQAIDLFTAIQPQLPVSYNKEEEYGKLQQLIAVQSTPVAATKRASFYRMLFRWQVAAAILMISLGAWFLLGPSAAATRFSQFKAVGTTGKNTIQKVILPDGSEVILNGQSSVSIGADFNKDKREVLLQGTAFFEVAKNPAKPFTVISGAVSTTALGTSFYIHQSSNAAPTTVSLLTGKVRIEAAGSTAVDLVPYEKASYVNKGKLEKSTYNRQNLVNWTNGTVEFKNACWEDVKHIFEEYFDLELVIPYKDTKHKDISFNGTFKADQPEAVLSSLEFTYDLKYSIQTKTVNIAF